MNHVRPYWNRHPLQLRIVAFIALLFVPVWLPVTALLVYWQEVAQEVKAQYRVCWRAVIHGRDA